MLSSLVIEIMDYYVFPSRFCPLGGSQLIIIFNHQRKTVDHKIHIKNHNKHTGKKILHFNHHGTEISVN